MRDNKPLWLHAELLKLADTLGERAAENSTTEPDEDGFHTEELKSNFDSVILLLRLAWTDSFYVFDCRALPKSFVYDSGDSFLEEPPEVHGPVRLPHPHCYFEFDDKFAVQVLTANLVDDEQIPVFDVAPLLYVTIQGSAPSGPMLSLGQFSNETDRPVMEPYEDSSFAQRQFAERGGKLVLGILTLLRDRLLLSEATADPKPWVNAKRRKLGKYPLSSARNILTVNVAAVRQQAGRVTLGHHESPALHWRRGHWRMLQRDSEAQKRIWVRRCLVGDPDRGFVSHREFKLIDEPGKIAAPSRN